MIIRITPPATSSERSDRCMTCRKLSPTNMKANSTQKAMPTSRTATRVRRSLGTARMMGMKMGKLPSGSSTSSSRMRAERKL